MSNRIVDDKIKWHEEQIKSAKERIKYHEDRILILENNPQKQCFGHYANCLRFQGCTIERQCKAVI